MRNKVDNFYGYNDTISGEISKMCLDAYDQYDNEISLGQTPRVAMARAIGDAIKNKIKILTLYNSIDRHLISQGMHEKEDFIRHIQKQTFMKIADDLYKSGNYRIQQFNNDYESRFMYQVGIFNIGELDKKIILGEN